MIKMLDDRLQTWEKDHSIADAFLFLVCHNLTLLLLPLLIYSFFSYLPLQVPHLQAYSDYCANYADALICLNKHAEREKFAQFLEKNALLGQHAKLPDYLILPVQRVPVCSSSTLM